MPCGAAPGTRVGTSLLPVPWITRPKSGMSTGTVHVHVPTVDEHYHSSVSVIIHRMQIWRTTRSSPGTSHESEASEASVFCFDNASLEKSCFVDGLVCFISQCLRVFEFLNVTRRE